MRYITLQIEIRSGKTTAKIVFKIGTRKVPGFKIGTRKTKNNSKIAQLVLRCRKALNKELQTTQLEPKELLASKSELRVKTTDNPAS